MPFLGLLVAVVGSLVAVFVPSTGFDLVLEHFIGSGGPAHTTPWQRAVAVVGALLGGWAVSRLRLSRAMLEAPSRERLVLLGVPLAALLAANLGLVAPTPRGVEILGVVLVLGCAAVLFGDRPRAWLLPTAAGLAYGCFSGLWHCCPPLWTARPEWVLWLVALSLALGAIGRVAASARLPVGELVGALVFAVAYPWHTPAWFAQCLVAGAFATAMVRQTGTGWAPALFLGTAYVAHMTLPFAV